MEITIRTYPVAIAPASLPDALSVATNILGRAGVRVAWLPCGQATDRPTPCDSPLNPNEFALRLVTLHDKSMGNVLALGFAMIDTQQKTGALATVYLDRVQWLAREAGIGESIVLGRAIAHEIGHLLIGTNQHTTTGLMRAVWTRKDLERDRADQWIFTPANAAAIHTGSHAGIADRSAR